MAVILWEEERAVVRNGNAVVTENKFSNRVGRCQFSRR